MATPESRRQLDLSFKSPIRQLDDTNYSEWLVDVRAMLRKQKLWKYTQEKASETLTPAALAKWIEGSMDAADAMTPTISVHVKPRLDTGDFNCGFKMMTHVTELYRPQGDGEFMRLTKEYYTLEYVSFESVTAYLTHIKSLEERILATNVVLTPDKQTILCLSMSLPEHLQYLTKIWAVTPEMTAAKATTMLLEEERKGERPKSESISYGLGVSTRGEMRPGGIESEKCKTCKKNHGGVCWDERPDLAPGWLQEKRATKRKRTESTTESATAAMAYSF